MTTKTQIVMVALVAVTVMSFGLTPAFAASYGSAQVQATTYGATSDEDEVNCGTGKCLTKISLNNPQDRVTYFIGTNGNNCDVNISVSGLGSTYTRDHGAISGEVAFTINKTIDTGDKGTIVAIYSNCT